MEIIQILLSLFFTYFVLMMTDIQLLLNCSLQKFLKENILIKHIIIFFSIFVFTFVLGWYRFDALKVEHFSEQKNQINFVNKNILWQYFKSTLLIYIIFIISTNNEGIYILIFLVSCLCLTLLQVYIKSVNKDIHKQIYKYYYINQNLKNKIIKTIDISNINNINDFNKIVLYHNITYIWFIILILILFLGMFNYYLKRKKEYNKNWSWIKFLFGNNYCKGIKY
tara:strand:- start:226 stop:897 length:672 start_codon:yes stop_codon:yes gene_type:complete